MENQNIENQKNNELKITAKSKWWAVVESNNGHEYTLVFLHGIDAVGIFKYVNGHQEMGHQEMINYFHGGYDNSGEMWADTLENAALCIKDYELLL